MKALYTAIFIDDRFARDLVERQDVKLNNVINNMHVTLKFNPDACDEFEITSISGQEVKFIVNGYGSSKDNSGFRVILPADISKYYKNDCTPHITVSISDNGKPKDTRDVEFKSIDPFYVTGKIGICYSN